MTQHDTRDDSSVQARIADIFTTRMNLEPPPPHDDLFDAGILDSLALVDLLLHLEREFGMRCSLEDLELDNFRSIDRIAQLVQAGQSPAPPPPAPALAE